MSLSPSLFAAPSQPAEADTTAELRLLLVDLQALVDRLGLKEQSRALAQTLKAVEDLLAGPRSVALLLADRADLKRRFLERLLGPVPELPECTDATWRITYGREPECVVPLPEGLTAVLPLHQAREFLERRGADLPSDAPRIAHLPSPALERGLAVVDTPSLAAMTAERLVPLLEASAVSLLIVGPECALQPGAEACLRTLPEASKADRGARLQVVIEDGGALHAAAAATARAALAETLAGIGLAEATIIPIGPELLQSDASLANMAGRLIECGRDRWLAEVRSALGEALDDVESTTQLELKLAGLGMRQVRLRRGLGEIETMQRRFRELRGANLPGAPPIAETTPAAAAQRMPASPEASGAGGSPVFVSFAGGAKPTVADPGWRTQLRRIANLKVRVRGRDHSTPAAAPTSEGGIFRRPRASRAEGSTDGEAHGHRAAHGWMLRAFGGALTVVFLGLLLWAVWPHSPVHSDDGGQWNYQPPAPSAPAGEANAPLPPDPQGLDLPPVEADTQPTPRSSELETGTLGESRAASRLPLAKPIPKGQRAGAARSRRRRDFLGIGKLWHFVRHGHEHKRTDE